MAQRASTTKGELKPSIFTDFGSDGAVAPDPHPDDAKRAPICATAEIGPDNVLTAEDSQQKMPALPVAGADNEVWVRNQILTAMRMAVALKEEIRVTADTSSFEHGLRGIAEGAAIEILGTLGFDLHQLVNLHLVYSANLNGR
jgi:hypothetical protein